MEDNPSSSKGYRLVPWQSWDEWKMVKENLFSSSPYCVNIALKRIKAWESRGCLPIPVAITVEIVEVQQTDPYFRKDISGGHLNSEKMLCLLYSMAIMRLVNGFVDQSQDKAKDRKRVSIAKAADEIGLPRLLIDIRHESSHRGLPSLKLLHFAIQKAVSWLMHYYWERQAKAIPDIFKDIDSMLHKTAHCLKVKMKKETSKTLRSILLAYSSYPADVATLLLENCLCSKSVLSHSGEVAMYSGDSTAACSKGLDTLDLVDLDDWKRVIKKLSHKKTDFLLVMLKAALDKIDACAAQKPTDDQCALMMPFEKEDSKMVDDIASLASWILECLKDLVYSDTHHIGCKGVQDGVLRDKLQDLLLVCFGKLTSIASLSGSCLVLSQLVGKESLTDSIKKLAEMGRAERDFKVDSIDKELEFEEQEETLREAARNIELLKRCRENKKAKVAKNGDTMWTVTKSWKPCPIGKLPSLSSAGRLTALDRFDCGSTIRETTTARCKRDATYDLESSEHRDSKKMRELVISIRCESNAVDAEGPEPHDVEMVTSNADDSISESQASLQSPVEGMLLIDGSLQQCGPDMLRSIQSKICIFDGLLPELSA